MVQNLHSRFIQPTAIQLKPEAYRRVLGWAYPSRGLPWTWKYSYKCTQTLSAACWSQAVVACSKAEAVNDCYPCSCSVFNYIPDFRAWETRAAVAGKWPGTQGGRNFCLNPTSSICIPGTSLSNHSIDRWLTFSAQVSQQPNATSSSGRFSLAFREKRPGDEIEPNANLDRNVNLKRER